MTTRVVRTDSDREALVALVRTRALPFTVEITKGARRSLDQNRLQRRLIGEIAAQLEEEPEAVRAYCKLVLGVPILRAENGLFRERYDAVVKGLPYETKIALMSEPIDLPVTRLMSTEQKTRYLDAIYRHFGERGVVCGFRRIRPPVPIINRPAFRAISGHPFRFFSGHSWEGSADEGSTLGVVW